MSGDGEPLDGRLIAYFTAWGIYARGYEPTMIPGDKITHLNYAFANINSAGECILGDSYADIEKSYPGDVYNQPMKGNFNQINNVTKSKHPFLKTIISIGGWTWSKYFSDVALTSASRNKFITSAVKFMKKYLFDGIDIDWEYPVAGGLPSNHYRPEDGDNYLLLLQGFRKALDAQAAKDNKTEGYILSIAAPGGKDKMQHLNLKAMSKELDWFNIMTYDYNGCWSNTSAPMDALYYDPKDIQPMDKYYNGNWTVQNYLENGVPPEKIHLGVGFYGRGVEGVEGSDTDGWLYKKFKKCPKGTWDDATSGHTGTYDYRDIASKIESGWTRHWDETTKVPYVHGGDDIVISYDDTQSLEIKTDYVKSNNLGGIFTWSLDSDRNGELLRVLYNRMHGKCKNDCSHHGWCSLDNLCNCDPGWIQSDCSECVCMGYPDHICSNHGSCSKSPNKCSCNCDPYFLGADCSIQNKPTHCSAVYSGKPGTGYFSVAVKMTTDTALKGWTVDWKYTGDEVIKSCYGDGVLVNQTSGHVFLSNNAQKKNIAAGSTVTVDCGGNSKKPGKNPPSPIKFNGVECSMKIV